MSRNSLFCNTSIIRGKFLVRFNKMAHDILLKPKLETFIYNKNLYGTEQYVTANLSMSQRSVVAQLRTEFLLWPMKFTDLKISSWTTANYFNFDNDVL